MAFGLPPSARTPTSAPDPRGVFEGAAEHLRGGARPPRRALPRREVPARRSSPAASPADPRAARTVPPSAGGRSRGEGCSAGLPAARLSPLCRGGLFNQLTGLAVGLFRVCLAHRARSLGRPRGARGRLLWWSGSSVKLSHSLGRQPRFALTRICLCLQDILTVEWGRARQRGRRRGARGRSVKLPWAPNPVQMAFWTVSDTLCASSRAPFDPVRSERRPSRVQSLHMVSVRELLLGLWRGARCFAFHFAAFCFV